MLEHKVSLVIKETILPNKFANIFNIPKSLINLFLNYYYLYIMTVDIFKQ